MTRKDLLMRVRERPFSPFRLIVSEGATYTLGLSASDPGTDTINHWTINWGDGVIQIVTGQPSSVTHVYGAGGTTFTISATATDEDGTFNANNLSVTVNRINNPPLPAPWPSDSSTRWIRKG